MIIWLEQNFLVGKISSQHFKGIFFTVSQLSMLLLRSPLMILIPDLCNLLLKAFGTFRIFWFPCFCPAFYLTFFCVSSPQTKVFLFECLQGRNLFSFIRVGQWHHLDAVRLSVSLLLTPLIVDFLPPDCWDNKFLFFKPPSLWYLVTVALGN